jgi:hypothetical protein
MILLAGILRAEIIGTEPRTSALPVADLIDAWRAREEGPCAHCGTRTGTYGLGGNPLCADCRPQGTAEIPPSARQITHRGAALQSRNARALHEKQAREHRRVDHADHRRGDRVRLPRHRLDQGPI